MKLTNIYLILSLICISLQLFANSETEKEVVYKYERIGDYVKWQDRASAIEYYLDGEKKDYLDPKENVKRYTEVNAIVNEIYEGYIKMLGLEDQRDQIPKPLVFLLNNSSMGSGAGLVEFNNDTTFQTNAIFLDSSDINTIKSAYGTIAHELSHFFMKDGANYDFEDVLKSVYLTTDNQEDCIDCTEFPDSPGLIEIRDQMIDLVNILEIAGAHSLAELNHIPFNVFANENDSVLFFKEILKRRDKTSKECTQVNDLYEKIEHLLIRSNSNFDQELHLIVRERVELIRLTLHIHDKAPKCFNELNKDKAEIIKLALDLDGATAKDIMEYFDLEDLYDLEKFEEFEELSEYHQSSIEVLSGDLTVFDTVVAFQKINYLERRKKESALGSKLNKIRLVTDEDVADMNAVKVLNFIKKEQDAVEYTFIKSISVFSDQIKCQKHIDQGIEPPYGLFSDTHHANCWRAFRANRFQKTMPKN